MPAIKSAKKKLRQDKKRQTANKAVKDAYKKAVKEAKTHLSTDSIRKAYASTDKAAKDRIIHKNKAARLKSLLAKLLKASKK